MHKPEVSLAILLLSLVPSYTQNVTATCTAPFYLMLTCKSCSGHRSWSCSYPLTLLPATEVQISHFHPRRPYASFLQKKVGNNRKNDQAHGSHTVSRATYRQGLRKRLRKFRCLCIGVLSTPCRTCCTAVVARFNNGMLQLISTYNVHLLKSKRSFLW